MITIPEGFNYQQLISDYFNFMIPFIIPSLIASAFVVLISIIKNAKRV